MPHAQSVIQNFIGIELKHEKLHVSNKLAYQTIDFLLY